jgi:hypothetical protein
LIGSTPFNLAHVMPSGAGESISFDGGETSINNTGQHDPVRNQRLMLGASCRLSPASVVTLRHTEDLAIENGFQARSEWMLRYSRRF